MNAVKLNEIEKERKDLLSRLNELNDEYYKLSNENDLQDAEAAFGRFYRNKSLGMGEECVFHPLKRSSGIFRYDVYLEGEYVSHSIRLIGEESVFATNRQIVSIKDFKDDYEEISKAEYDEIKRRAFDSFMPKED